MRLNVIVESTIIGLASQAIIGWVSPLSMLFTGFLVGIVARNKSEGTVSGFITGIIIGVVFVLLWALHLQPTYVYPTNMVMSTFGIVGIYGIALTMVGLSVVGGRVGGSMVQRWISESYTHGLMVGRGKQIAEGYSKSQTKKGR